MCTNHAELLRRPLSTVPPPGGDDGHDVDVATAATVAADCNNDEAEHDVATAATKVANNNEEVQDDNVWTTFNEIDPARIPSRALQKATNHDATLSREKMRCSLCL